MFGRASWISLVLHDDFGVSSFTIREKVLIVYRVERGKGGRNIVVPLNKLRRGNALSLRLGKKVTAGRSWKRDWFGLSQTQFLYCLPN